MTPKQRYEKDLQRTDFYSDEAQARAVDALDNLYHQWLNYLNQPVVRPSVWQKLIGKKPTVTQPPQGLYMWGGVGRGKTYLMDTFFEALPTEKKLRVHFHRFMTGCTMNYAPYQTSVTHLKLWPIAFVLRQTLSVLMSFSSRILPMR